MSLRKFSAELDSRAILSVDLGKSTSKNKDMH